jgi:hypothetical protein
MSPFTDLAIDIPPPAQLAAPLLAAASDSGSSVSDRITKVTTPTFTGTGAQANATIKLYEGDTVVGQGTSNADGTWSVAADSEHALIDGVHSISVRQVDTAGNASASSATIDVTIDTMAPTEVTYTDLVALGSDFKLWFSETIVHGSVGNATLFNGLGGLVSSLVGAGGDSSHWDETTYDGHPSTVFRIQPTVSGHLTIELGTIQDLAGNVTVIGTKEYVFTIPLL